MQQNLKIVLLITGLLAIGALVVFIKQSGLQSAPSVPVFSCSLGSEASIHVTAQNELLTMHYKVGNETVSVNGDSNSGNVMYRHDMWARAEDKQLRFHDGEDSYVIFNRWAAAEFEGPSEVDYSGLLIFKDYDQIDLQFCQDSAQLSPDHNFTTLPDDSDNVIPDMDAAELVMDNIDDLDAIDRDDLVVPGAYRDAHGCIPSAGYEWSETKQACARPWLEEPEEQDDTVQEVGLIKTVEDGVYPMFVVTIAFPKREFEETFNLNIESVDIDHAALNNAVGQYASFAYTSKLKPQLVDLLLDGKAIMGEEITPALETFTGVLSGAKTVTESDLPSTVTITDKDGKQEHFAYYIPPEMLAANGKEVTAYYWVRTENNIVDMTLE